MRIFRIDDKTLVEAPASLSDEEAIERYYDHHTRLKRPPVILAAPFSHTECRQEGILSPEELKAVIDDSQLPEE